MQETTKEMCLVYGNDLVFKTNINSLLYKKFLYAIFCLYHFTRSGGNTFIADEYLDLQNLPLIVLIALVNKTGLWKMSVVISREL